MKYRFRRIIACILTILILLQGMPQTAFADANYRVGVKEVENGYVTESDVVNTAGAGLADMSWSDGETEKTVLVALSWDTFPESFSFDTARFLKYAGLASLDLTYEILYKPDGWSYSLSPFTVKVTGVDNGLGYAYMLVKLVRGGSGRSILPILSSAGVSVNAENEESSSQAEESSLIPENQGSEAESESSTESVPAENGTENGSESSTSGAGEPNDSSINNEESSSQAEDEENKESEESTPNDAESENELQGEEGAVKEDENKGNKSSSETGESSDDEVSGESSDVQGESQVEGESENASQTEDEEGANPDITVNLLSGPLRAGDSSAETYNIIINYVFADQTIAADPFVLTLNAGESCNEQVPNPHLVGYDPYVGTDDVTSDYVTLNYTNIDENKQITVTYLPAEVNYTVRHYLQNANDDNYTLADEEVLVGLTGDTVGNVEKDDYEGFYSLLYVHPTIAADGSTVVDIYYDRFYFLMYFDLQGGTGVDPIYARYGSNVGNLANPTREGYAFAGWDTPVPTTVPLGNKTYTASWSPRSTTYRVIYWYENVSDNSYSIMDTKTLSATTETVVNSASYANDSFSGNDTAHFTHDASKDENYTVSGDGMTNVNVYYSRNIVTFNFTDHNGNTTTLQGKYNSTFAENGCAWPTPSSGYTWKYGNTRMSYMTAFIPPSGQGLTVNFTEDNTGTTTGKSLYFYTQNIDGTYNTDSIEAADASYTTSSTFTLTNKYAGFKLKDYRKKETTTRTVWRIGSTTGPEYSGSDFYIAQSGTPNATTTYYGLVNGNMVQLSNGNYYTYGDNIRYTGAYKYAQQSGASTSSVYYGVVNGEVVYPVTNQYIWTYNGEAYEGTRYSASTASSTGVTYYYVNGGQIKRAYYYNRYWYTQAGTINNGVADFNYSSSTTYYDENRNTVTLYNHDGLLCTRSGGGWFSDYEYTPYNGVLYTRGSRNGAAPTPRYILASGDNGVQYGFIDGAMVQLTRSSTPAWVYSGSVYTGGLYTRSDATNFPNDSVQYYGFANGEMTPITAHTGILVYNGIEYTDTFYTLQTNPGTSGGPYYVPYNNEMVRVYPVQETSDWGAWNPAVDGTTQISQSGDYQIRFERVSYTLSFYNYDDYINSRTTNVRYEGPLAQYEFTPPYPDALPWAAYQFVGWYDNQELVGTPFDFTTAKMPMNNLTLFAKWEPIEFTVRVFLDLPSAEQGTSPLASHDVFYGQLAPVPEEPVRPEMQFIGWFYKDARTGAEIPFNFSATPITQNTDVYAKWTSSVLRNYEFHFETEDGREVAEPIISSGLMGSTKTVQARDELYHEFESGWFPKTKSHSILIQDSEEYNIYTFEYVFRTNVPYTVNYLDSRTSEPIAPSKTVSDNTMILVSEKYMPIVGYIPDAYRKSLIVSVTDETQNVINFYYTADSQHAYFATMHYIETAPGTWRLYNEFEEIGNIGDQVTAEPMTIQGYNLDTTVTGTIQSGTVSAEGLEMRLYYKPSTYPYYVRYLEYRTEQVLAPEKSGIGTYQRTVYENAIDILGYDLVTTTPQSLEIRYDPNGELRRNVITFYYRVQQATFSYNVVPVGSGTVSKPLEHTSVRAGLLEGSTVTPYPGWEFLGWFLDEACTIPVTSAQATISGENGETIVPVKDANDLYSSKSFYAKLRQTSGTLELSMRIEGPLGNITDEFDYTLELEKDGEPYNGNIVYNRNGSELTVPMSNGQYMFRMGHLDNVTFTLPSGYTYTVTQRNNTGKTYIETPTSFMGIVVYEGSSGIFINSLPQVAPSDVRTQTAPYAFMFMTSLLAVAVMAWFLKKRKTSVSTSSLED